MSGCPTTPGPWTADRMLEAWGVRQFGKLKARIRYGNGGEDMLLDDELQAMWFVERVEGFHRARQVLAHVYGNGEDIASFQMRGPGETLMRAILRRGWGEWLGRREADIPKLVLEEFKSRLQELIDVNPFVPIRPFEEESAEQIARSAGSKRG